MAVDWNGVCAVALAGGFVLAVAVLPERLHRRYTLKLQPTPRRHRRAPSTPGASWWQRGVLGEPTSVVGPERPALVGSARPPDRRTP